VSVVLLSHLVPWMPNGSPGGCSPQVRIRVDRDRAAALVIALYAVMLLAFRRLF
jgi:hypothetical protein